MSAVETELGRRFVDALLDDVAGREVDELRRAAGRARFDYLACVTAGRSAASPAADALGGPAGDALAAHVLDRDDVHWLSLTHPGGIVWPVVLALAGESGLDEEGVVLAAAAGYEAIARLAIAFGPDHRTLWHATATAGTIGAAVAAACALGLDREAATGAVGHAASVTGGSITCMLERSGTRFFHRAHSVSTGVAAARAAAAGVRATRAGLESERGLFAAMSGRPEDVLAARGRSALEEVSFRLHAATGFAHAAVEAAQELAPVESPQRVRLELPAAAAALASGTDPQTGEDAWWSTPYAVAVTLLGRDLDDRSLLDDPDVRSLLATIEVDTAETSRVTVDGRSAERNAARAATDDDLVRKWSTLNLAVEPPLELLA